MKNTIKFRLNEEGNFDQVTDAFTNIEEAPMSIDIPAEHAFGLGPDENVLDYIFDLIDIFSV